MTAAELIAELQKYPPETRVVYSDYERLADPGFDIEGVAFHEPDADLVLSVIPTSPRQAIRLLEAIENGRHKPWIEIR